MGNGIGGHQNPVMKNDEWLTPPDIIENIGSFDLDPCSPIVRPWDTADEHYNINDDGLNKDWYGRVWCNPPYGLEAAKWLKKLADHDNGVALLFARTETRMFFEHVWEKATGILFIEGRLYFHYVDGTRAKSNSGAPSCLISYGEECLDILESCEIKGKLIVLNN